MHARLQVSGRGVRNGFSGGDLMVDLEGTLINSFRRGDDTVCGPRMTRVVVLVERAGDSLVRRRASHVAASPHSGRNRIH